MCVLLQYDVTKSTILKTVEFRQVTDCHFSSYYWTRVGGSNYALSDWLKRKHGGIRQ